MERGIFSSLHKVRISWRREPPIRIIAYTGGTPESRVVNTIILLYYVRRSGPIIDERWLPISSDDFNESYITDIILYLIITKFYHNIVQ